MSTGPTIHSSVISDGAVEPTSIERIRGAALTIFAERGIETTSLRTIARAAGVSVGLVQHHFHSKANLVQAVDEYVMRALAELLAAPLPSAPEDPVAEAAQRVMTLMAEHVELTDYLCRALVENTPTGVRIFDALVQICTGYWDQLTKQGLTQPGLDPLWIVLSPMTLVLGTFILRSHLSRQLPEALTTPTQLQRWQDATRAIIESGQLRPPSQIDRD
jgi:AcrR family transcriptional regulator